MAGPAKILAEVFGNAAGLGSQPLRWRRSITQTDREVSFGLCRRRDRDHRPTTLTLTIGRGQRERSPPNVAYLNDRGRERPYLNQEGDRQRETTKQPPSHLHLNDTRREGERPPPSHTYFNDRTKQDERSPPSRWVVVSFCLLLSLR